MNLGISGMKALVTGASRGIGRSIAVALASEGVRVCIVARTAGDLDSVMKSMGGTGHYAIVADLVEESGPRKLVGEVVDNFGEPDILVNNLGGSLERKDPEYKEPLCDISMYREVYRLNFEVTHELCTHLVPHMVEEGWGRVVNISSLASLENHGTIPYCTSKAALTAYTRSMGRYLAPTGVVMSALIPGAIYTEGGDWDIKSKLNPEHARKFLEERQRIGRFGTPEEMASVVLFLCSRLASFCTGSIVPADGGMGRGYFSQ
jgi:NAD(P)-dependent dehydrogenase (short-subunit alcohol dehydrogenase family)